MNANELRQMQAPIKAKYQEDPARALQTFQAIGIIAPDDLICRIDTPFVSLHAGLHPAAGGSGQDACSGDMLMEALVACAGVTFSVVATAMGISFRFARVIAKGETDFRGTLGTSKETPVGITNITMAFEIDSNASDDALEKLAKQTERYCVILQTLKTPPSIVTHLNRIST
jgi:uncharacterized OsmC-like protein